MSSIFSDPTFRRGVTLLDREAIDYDNPPTNTVPTAGKDIVGQVKVFQDVHPRTGTKNSNRLVYCVAARYKGSTVSADTLSGKLVAFSATAPLAEFSATATKTNVSDGRSYGVVDEYLPQDANSTYQIRTDDIVWVVVKGPTTVAKENTAALNAGASVVVSNTAGSVAASGTANAGSVQIGEQIAGSNVAQATTAARINLFSDRI